MQSSIMFYLNGKIETYSGNMSARLLDVLRNLYMLTGTKCGCMEGECGACSVIIDGKLRNSCLVAMGSLDGAGVTTIEGYSTTQRFSILSSAYESVSAVQCGFCIPGMLLASECLLSKNTCPSEDEIRTAISGNLCRCTGYNAIVKAIGIAACNIPHHRKPDCQSCDKSGTSDYSNLNHQAPMTLDDALRRLKLDPGLTVYCGGTDLMADGNCTRKNYLFLRNIPGLTQISEDEQYIRFGAACTFTEVIESSLTPSILKEMCLQIAAPAIRNAGTLGGNIGNGSAKADSALIFITADSMLRLVSADNERTIPISSFYLGNGKTALNSDELIAEILMPKYGTDNYYLKKVGARNALAISRVSFAGILDIKDGIIKKCATAFGAVADTIIRLPDIDKMFTGKTAGEAKLIKNRYISAYNDAIIPRRGRVGIEYRKDVCMNLLRDFLEVNGI